MPGKLLVWAEQFRCPLVRPCTELALPVSQYGAHEAVKVRRALNGRYSSLGPGPTWKWPSAPPKRFP